MIKNNFYNLKKEDMYKMILLRQIVETNDCNLEEIYIELIKAVLKISDKLFEKFDEEYLKAINPYLWRKQKWEAEKRDD